MENKKKIICLTKKELSELEDKFEELEFDSFDSDTQISPSRLLLNALYKKARAEYKKADAEKDFNLVVLKIEVLDIYHYPINGFKDDFGDPFWLDEDEIKKITKNFNEFIYNDKRLIELTDEKLFEYISSLTPRGQQILEMCFGIGKHDKRHTLEEIAKELDCNAIQVRVTVERLIRRLRMKVITKNRDERKKQTKADVEDVAGV